MANGFCKKICRVNIEEFCGICGRFDHGKTKHFDDILGLVAVNPDGNGTDFLAAFCGKGERKVPGHKGAPRFKNVIEHIAEKMGYCGRALAAYVSDQHSKHHDEPIERLL